MRPVLGRTPHFTALDDPEINVQTEILSKSVTRVLFGQPYVKRFALCHQTVVYLSGCLSVCPVLSICNVGVLWPNGWMNQEET